MPARTGIRGNAEDYYYSRTFVEHLVCLVQDEHLDVSGAKVSSFDHVKHPPWRPGHNVLAVVQLADVFSDVCSSDARVTLHTHVVTQSQYNLGGEEGWSGEGGMGGERNKGGRGRIEGRGEREKNMSYSVSY